MAKGRTDEKAIIELIINGEKSKTTIKEVRTTMIGLERQLSNMKKADDPAGYEKLRKQLDQVRRAHNSMVNELKGGEGSLNKFKMTWKDIAAGFVGGSVINQSIFLIQSGIVSLIASAGKLSDSLADVSKQTGLTGDDLKGLNEDLMRINTRTPVEQLRQLAVVAGKLGYETRSEVLSFVKAANMINVALGEDLGGNVEDVLNDIGKLVEIFGLEEEFGIEKSLLKIGSAINTVGASSQANEGYLVNWSKRFAGIAPNAGISISDTLGMAAAADILGQSSELSATNIGKMIIAMGKDVPYFARVARMSVKQFSDLLKTDGNEAFLRVLEGAKSSTKGVEGLAKMLETLGIEGSEGAAVLGAFAKNTQLVREQQEIANAAFEKGTSVIDEYNTKNQNAAAVLEKIGKFFTNTWERTVLGAASAIESFGKVTGMISSMDDAARKYSAQQEKVNALAGGMTPLINRYDELKKKTSLSKDEQAEMKKIIDRIAEVLPNSVTRFDQYGNAIDISTGKARDAIEVQKQLLKVLNRDAVKEVDERMVAVRRSLENNQKLLNDTSGVVEYQGRKGYVRIPRSEDQTRQLVQNIKDRNAELAELSRKRRELLGELDPTSQKSTGTKGAAAGAGDSPGTGGALKNDDLKKAADERRRLLEDLHKNQQQITLSTLADQEKEIQAAQYKYDELRKRAGKNASDLEQINDQHGQEVAAINEKYNKKYLADFDKSIRAQLDGLNKASKEEEEFEQQRQDEAAKRRDKELFEINDHYQRQIALAKSRGLSTIQLEADWKAELDKLTEDREKKRKEDFLEGVFDSYRSELAIADEAGTSREEIVRSHLERLKLLRQEYGDLDIEQQKRINSEIAKADREMLAIKLDQINKTGEAMKVGGQVISDVLTLTTNNQNEYAEFQKALGLFQVAVDTGTAVAAAVAAGTKGDPYTVALRIAAAVAAVTAGMVKAKQLINAADQPEAPAFRADGGPTDLASIRVDKSGTPQGWVTRPTLFSLGRRSYVAGEDGVEYVISEPMLRNPIVADFANMLEAMRTGGRAFADGGSTAMPAAAPATFEMAAQFARMISLLEEVANKPTGINYNTFEKYRDQVDQTRYRASA